MNPLRRSLSLILPLIVLLTAAASAQAVDRYASPTGTGDCSIGNPCSLKVAYDQAPFNANVFVGPGTYGSPTSPVLDLGEESTSQTGLKLQAQDPTQRPTIYAASSGGGKIDGIRVTTGSISDLNVIVIGSNVLYGVRAPTVNRVSVTGSASYAGCSGSASISNSICSTSSNSGYGIAVGIGTGSPTSYYFFTYTNVTAWAPGATAHGIQIDAGSYAAISIFIRNSIVHGGKKDLELLNNGTGGSDADAILSNSNFATADVSGSGSSYTLPTVSGNQSAAPQLVNPASGDFHELTASPTVDAGADTSLIGANDVFYLARTIGAHTDIGAHEYSPPPPSNPPVAPKLGKIKLAHSKFNAAIKGAGIQASAAAKKKSNKGRGSTFTVTSSGEGTVYFTLFKVTKKKGKKTTYKKLKGSESATLIAGSNKFWFSGRWGKKKLSAGNYQLRGVPTVKGNTISGPKGDEPGTSKGGTSSIVKK